MPQLSLRAQTKIILDKCDLQFLSISRGSVEETKYLLLLGRDLNYIDTETYSSFRDDYERVSQMISKLMLALRSRLPGGGVR